MSETSEQEKPKFTVRQPATGQEEQPKWRTAFVVVMDEQGRVLVDNARGAFAHCVDHEASEGEAALMLGIALEEFKVGQLRAMIFEAVKMELIKASRAMKDAEM